MVIGVRVGRELITLTSLQQTDYLSNFEYYFQRKEKKKKLVYNKIENEFQALKN